MLRRIHDIAYEMEVAHADYLELMFGSAQSYVFPLFRLGTPTRVGRLRHETCLNRVD